MNLLALTIGIAIPGVFGWLLVRTVEGSHPLLLRGERIVYALVLGPTAMMLLTLLCQAFGVIHFTMLGFLIPTSMLTLVLALWNWRRGTLNQATTSALQAHPTPSRALLIIVCCLLLWSGLKVSAGIYSAFTVPTYWDDSFNNWNMRGKLFYVTEKIVLEIAGGNEAVQDSTGVSSYPMSLPLMKTWLSVLRGSWQESLINGIQVLWYLGIIGTLWYGLRRRMSASLSALGVYAFISLPLVLIHGTNPYAEVFLASHLLITLLCIANALDANDEKTVSRWLLVSGLSLGLLAFTKNEAMALYVPLVFATLGATLYLKTKDGTLHREHLSHIILQTIGLSALIIVPWLVFKYSHGLSFGNGKAVSGLGLSFNPRSIQSIWFQLSQEPNFLLLPLLLPVTVIIAGKDIIKGSKAILVLFVLIALLMQWSIFIFVTALATEAIKQTGLSRGAVHIAPVAVFALVVLWEEILSKSHK